MVKRIKKLTSAQIDAIVQHKVLETNLISLTERTFFHKLQEECINHDDVWYYERVLGALQDIGFKPAVWTGK